MANRHQRRKRAKANLERKLLGLAQAERSRRIAEVVRNNKSEPIERNFYPTLSSTAKIGLESVSTRAIKSDWYDPKTAKRIAKHVHVGNA